MFEPVTKTTWEPTQDDISWMKPELTEKATHIEATETWLNYVKNIDPDCGDKKGRYVMVIEHEDVVYINPKDQGGYDKMLWLGDSAFDRS